MDGPKGAGPKSACADSGRAKIAGTRLHLRVRPGAERSAIVGRHGSAWKVRVAGAPERGKANRELLDLLSTALSVPRTRLALVAGGTSRDKVVAIDGLSGDEAEQRLAAAAGAR